MAGHPAGTRLQLPAEHREHQQPCPACQGSGVTGERYELPTGPYVLLVDVICPACGGCGNGNPAHAGCQPEQHAYPDEDDNGESGGEPTCWSCGSARGWYPVQGFTGEGDNTRMYLLRMPCGCSETRLIEAPAGASQ